MKHNKEPEEKPVSAKKEIMSWIICIVCAVAVALLLRTFVFGLIRVDGDSMNNTLANTETVFVEKVSRYFDNISRGQILIVNYPNMDGAYVKRVMGLPGDEIEVKDGSLFVNGEAVSESYIAEPVMFDSYGPYTVPEGCYFVMGDNRNNSLDSRDVGPIPKSDIIGHAVFVIWPVGEIRGLS